MTTQRVYTRDMTTTQNTAEAQKLACETSRYNGSRSASGTKTHLGSPTDAQAECGAKVMPRATKFTEITCDKCAKYIDDRMTTTYGFTTTSKEGK